jgi:hypothetical protein
MKSGRRRVGMSSTALTRHWRGESEVSVRSVEVVTSARVQSKERKSLVSPGNKGSNSELRAFVEKTADMIQQGVHVLVIDQFPPTRRDPQGLHKAIWDEFEDDDFVLPADKPLTLVSYSAGAIKTAYV